MTLRIYGDLALQGGSGLLLTDAESGHSVQLLAPAGLASDISFQLPASLGQNNQVMTTDASGKFSFSFLADANVAANAAIALSKLAAVTVSRALVSDENGVMGASSVTATELGFLSGVTGSVQTQLNSEASARSSADSQLASDLAAEVSARQAAVSSEASARQAADSQLTSDLAAEVSARQAAMSSEVSARQAADSVLDGKIATEKGRIDAILLAADADKDSFKEIVDLINSVDATNDQAFAGYVTSNNAALAAETSARQAADASEASARQAADTTLQSNINAEASARAAAVSAEASARSAADTTLQNNIDSEASARASAVSGEASARQAADAALQSTINALTVDAMTDVSTASKASGDLFQWDAVAGKWKNVAPLAGASSTTSSVVIESLYLSSTGAGMDGTSAVSPDSPHPWALDARGITFQGNNSTLSKIEIKLRKQAGHTNGGTVKLKLSTQMGGATIAESTPVDVSTISSSGNGNFVAFNFSSANYTIASGTSYFAELVLSGPDTFLAMEWGGYNAGIMGFYYRYTNPAITATDNTWTAKVYTSASSAGPSTPKVGVIKTNSSGMLDASFLGYDVNFGGHKLQGVSAPTSGTDAANKTYVDGEIASEASARASAVSTEQSARQAADASLQSQINALDSKSTAALTQEIANRQAGDSALQSAINTEKGRIDAILSASDADKDSFKEIVDLINSVDTANDQAFAGYVLSNNAAVAAEVSARQAADSSEASARQAADAQLTSDLAAEVSARQTADSSEASARQAADTTLQGNIDAEVSARQAAVSAEQTARQAADTAIYTYVDGHKFKADWVTADGATKVVTHNMGTQDVVIQVYDKLDGASLILDEVRTTANTITLNSKQAPGASGWRVLVLKV